MKLTFELGVMARGIAGNADESDQHPEVRLLRSAISRIESLERTLKGISEIEPGSRGAYSKFVDAQNRARAGLASDRGADLTD